MKLRAEKLGKRFQFDWIFRNLSLTCEDGQHIAITGRNGSGKSTLLQVLLGIHPPSEGQVEFYDGEKKINPDDYHKYLSIASPYLELIEEFSLTESILFQKKLKGLSVKPEELISRLGLTGSEKKAVKNFSSGMKTRLKLGLAFYSSAPILFLDEPTSNLDEQGINWYREEIKHIWNNKTVFIASNQTYEYEGVSEVLKIEDYKPVKKVS